MHRYPSISERFLHSPPRAAILAIALACLAIAAPGCARKRYVTVREEPRNVLAGPLGLIGKGGPLVRIATQTDVWNAPRVQHVT